ncbi:MAG: PD-(D/E)XK nuclease family protein [Vulcanimicrobiota bacterium]
MSLFFTQRSICVCPNERQALALWEADARDHQSRGERAWETLPVCSYSEFLRALHEEYWLAGSPSDEPLSLMNEWQERFLWIKVLTNSASGEGLLNLPAAARLAAEAWRLTNSYLLERELRAVGAIWPEETLVFMGWAEAFQATCRERGWLPACRLESELVKVITNDRLPPTALPKSIRFLGFAEWTPAARSLLQALESKGVEVVLADPPGASEQNWSVLPCAHQEDEIRSAGRWLREQLESNQKMELRVGLVLPDLASRRLEVHRLLTEVFQPSRLSDPRSDLPPICDFSMGLPLARFPLVADALELLNWSDKPRQLARWKILLSPFLGAAEKEFDSRALLFAKLQSDGRYLVGVGRILQLAQAEEEKPYRSPALFQRLKAAQAEIEKAPHKQLPSAWAGHFSDLLESLGWPGERKLNSPEYQTVTRWKSTLAGLGSLDSLLGPVDRHSAYAALRRISDETIYQPKLSRGGLEVMGTLEAVGLQFDRLWVAGLDDTRWPSAARPNPYLPFTLQRAQRVAHSTPDRELEFARLITERLVRAASSGVMSYPLYSEEQACRPSPLLRDLPRVDSTDLKLLESPTLQQRLLASSLLETIADPGPPPVSEQEKTRGGTSLFTHQSACPFRAYAYLRLDARPTETPEEGLNPRHRGTMLHAALEKLWSLVRTRQNWMQAEQNRHRQWLSESAEYAVEGMRRQRPDVLRGLMVKLEKERLLSLLAEWMELEMTRDEFEVVATEEKVELCFAGLTLKATVDRVDRLADGSLAVLDYKTGSPQVGDWLGERPREPQLPLYSVSHPRPVETICFARIKPGNMEFRGLSSVDEALPGVQASEYAEDGLKTWEQRKAEWTARLEALAQEFHDGHAVVDPAEGPKTCRYCGLEGLCRVEEGLVGDEP